MGALAAIGLTATTASADIPSFGVCCQTAAPVGANPVVPSDVPGPNSEVTTSIRIRVPNVQNTDATNISYGSTLPAGAVFVSNPTIGLEGGGANSIGACTFTTTSFSCTGGTLGARGDNIVITTVVNLTTAYTSSTFTEPFNPVTANDPGPEVVFVTGIPPVAVRSMSTPTIATQASAGNMLGAPVRDTATLSGGSSPTGTVAFSLFSDAACNNQVFTSTSNLSGGTATSANFTPTSTGTYYWTATYSGDANNTAATSPCRAPNESVVIRAFAAPACTGTLTGDIVGPVTVNSGESLCITNARVVGPVTVNPGGSLTVLTSKINRGITADNPAFFSVCGSDVSGPSTTPGRGIAVSNAGVPLRIGDPANGCAANRVAGDVTLTANTAGLTVGSNIVSGNVTLTNNLNGIDTVKANTIYGALGCSGNNPPPTNAGQPNTAGSKSGQCAAL